MMRLLILIFCATLFACDHHDEHDHSAGLEHSHGHEVASDSSPALRLDAGRKWSSDASTRAGMRRMQEIGRAALADSTDSESKARLAKQLEAELARVVRECTMQGPSHQMLHLYLARLTDVIAALRNADPAIARDAFERLNPTLQQFDSFFE
ncbi:MAG: hypothetical protein RIF32_12355 [Leptospirales bacterium]|jgi:hypothetical protein